MALKHNTYISLGHNDLKCKKGKITAWFFDSDFKIYTYKPESELKGHFSWKLFKTLDKDGNVISFGRHDAASKEISVILLSSCYENEGYKELEVKKMVHKLLKEHFGEKNEIYDFPS